MVAQARIRDVVIDCARPSRLAAFWSEALGYSIQPYDDTELERLRGQGIVDVADDPTVAVDVSNTASRLLFVKVPEAKTVKNRIHFDLTVSSVDDIAWPVQLGATARRSAR